ncbi:hypothetical protein BC939DRAFT_194256 [Gamsiella multidivaricata]|uniref:uncharacterized protein n=1 Tax=Gamsiella multidivaricata TaxID=101098 RepID=UPI00221F6534|nr:uncharacterized protein BC939DRAFT_194256 [Gamsiella multidivaricata]KAI7822225.1 hypothetical protein BC939DRAFT_194256 [Gamsiella multidivaricata]
MKKAQPKEFPEDIRRLTLAILGFSRMLLENCTNRNLYASYEQLNDLLHARDLDVLESCLRLLLRPAQRHSAQRSSKSIFTVSQDRLLALAHSWGNKEHGMDLLQLAGENVNIPEQLTALNFQFYRTISQSKPATDASTAVSDAPSKASSTFSTATTVKPSSSSTTATAQQTHSPTKQRRSSHPGSSPSTSTTVASTIAPACEGMVVIHATNIGRLGASDYEILAHFVKEYQIPEEHQFSLLNRIRVAIGISVPQRRQQLLIVRILAVAVMAHVLSEAVVIDKFLTFEPEIIQSLIELIHPDHKAPYNLQTVALFALDGLARLRNKQTDVLTAVNASASHGVLLYMLRRVIAGLDSDSVTYPQEFLDAIFVFISFIIGSQPGGTMVISAGIVPVLLKLLSNKHTSQLKNITKGVLILDSLVYGFSAAFTSFCSSDGLNMLVARVKDEVDFSLDLVKKAETAQISDTVSVLGAKDDTSPIPFERTALLKSMFKFVLHMMQSPGTQEGLRNLIDTTLPATLKHIMENPQAFGTAIYAHAINTMASFIHNEPTSLTILQDAKIPQTLLASLSKDIPASSDVVLSIPEAFGAICLNSQGLEMFNKQFKLRAFFDIFTSETHVRAFQDSDLASNLGMSVDELMRHQPSLKPALMSEVNAMLEGVLDMCSTARVSADEKSYCTLQKTRAKDAPLPGEAVDEEEAKGDKKESLVPILIEGATRFCESFFQNTASTKDFLKAGGIDILMRFYSLETLPYELASTAAFLSLSYLIKMLSETNPACAVAAVMKELIRLLENVKPLLESNNPRSDLIQYIDLTDSSEAEMDQGNKTIRSLISLYGLSGLMSDMFCAPTFSHGRNSASVLSAFIAARGDEALAGLGQLHRMCVWESIVINRALKKDWNVHNPKPKKLPGTTSVPGTVDFSLEEQEKDDKEQGTSPTIDQHSPTYINAKHFNFVLTQTPNCLTPMYQGLAKMLFYRRDVDSTQRANAFKIAGSLSRVLQAHISWQRQEKLDIAADRLTYLTTMLRLPAYLMLDDRNPPTLQTIIVVAFVRSHGLDTLFGTLDTIWKNMQLDPSAEDKTKMYAVVEIILGILQTLTSSKLLHDSSHTSMLTSRDDRIRRADFFEPHEFLIDTRLAILPKIKAFWVDPALHSCPSSLVRQLIQVLLNILKGDGELKPEAPPGPSIVLGGAPNLFGARPLVADAASVAILLDMGFPRAAAELALTRCANQLDRATEYLLTHQDIVAAAIYDQEREAAAARATANPLISTNETATGEPSSSSAVTGATASGNTETEPQRDGSDAGDAEILQRALEISVSGNDITTNTSEGSSSVAAASQSSAKSSESADSVEVHKARKEELTKERLDLKAILVTRSLVLLTEVDGIIFSVRDIFLFMFQSKDIPVLDTLFNVTASLGEEFNKADQEQIKERGELLGVHMRLFALLFAEASIQSKMQDYASKLLPLLMSTLTKALDTQTPQKGNTWLSPLLLMIEGYISLTDEPKVVPDETSAEGKAKAAQHDLEMTAAVVSGSDMEILLRQCLSLLKQDCLSKDVMLSVFRILVRLTRHHNLAIEFLRSDGLPIMFATLKPDKIGVQGQQGLIIMIMRHIIEDTNVLQASMEREITRWFSHPTRPRTVEIQTYLRHNNYMGLRDLDAFIAGTLKACKVAKHDSSYRALYLSLVKLAAPSKAEDNDDQEGATDDKGEDEKDDKDERKETDKEPNVDESGACSSSTAALSAAISEVSKKYTSEVSETVMSFLATELLNIRVPTNPPEKTGPSGDSAKDSTSKLDSASIASSSKNEADKTALATSEATLDHEFIYRCFLLQCLNELLVSYPSCKVDLMNYSRRRSSKDPAHAASKPKASWLSYLLNDLIPYRGTIAQATNAELRKQSIESNFASGVLVAMCSNKDDDEEKKSSGDLVQVRRFVVDGITRAFKDAIASMDSVEYKYSKFLSLSELSYKILGSHPVTGALPRTNEDTSINIVKVMLEKNFIMTLTNVVADIDLNYPHARVLVNAVLKPLEHLTKLSLKMSRASEPGAPKPRRLSTPLSGQGSGTGSGDDAPDLYRNSSLGMFDGTNIESGEDGESGDSISDEDMFEGEEFEEETASDASDISEDDLSDEDENEGEGEDDVVRNPFHDDHDGSEDEEDQDDEEHIEEEEDDDDEDIDAEIQEALDRDEEEGEDMVMEWDGDGHRPVLLDQDDIAEVIDDEDDDGDDSDEQEEHNRFVEGQGHLHHHHHHHHHHRSGDEGTEDDDEDDGDDDDEDASDDDEEDDMDDDEDGEGQGDLEDGDEPHRRRGRHNPWNMTSTFVINENALRNGRALFEPQSRRGRLPGQERGFIWDDFGADQGRLPHLQDDDLPTFRAPVRNPFLQVSDDAITHPLLAPPSSASTANNANAHRLRGGARIGLPDWQMFEELLNENAQQLLGRLFTGGALRPGHGGAFRLEVNNDHSTTLIPLDRPGGHHHHHHHHHGAGDALTATISIGHGSGDAAGGNKSDVFSIVHGFVPLSTSQRWSQECRMMYGATAQDKASRLQNHIINALIPVAKEESRLKYEREMKEMEQRRKADAERKKAAEEKRKAEEEARRIKEQEAEAARVAEEQAVSEREAARRVEEAAIGNTGVAITPAGTSMEVEGSPSSSAPMFSAPAPENATPPRRMVLIDGEEFDITDSDIDADFLEALPESMRREVYNDYLQAHRPQTTPASSSSANNNGISISNNSDISGASSSSNNINVDFLNALPPQMRDELDELIRGPRSAAAPAAREPTMATNAPPPALAGTSTDLHAFYRSFEDSAQSLGALQSRLAATASRSSQELERLSASTNQAIRRFLDVEASLRTTGPPETRAWLEGLSGSRAILADTVDDLQAVRDRFVAHIGRATNTSLPSSNKKMALPREAIQLVDKSSLATLVRLMFLPQPLSRNILNKLLVNLCENSKTRGDLLSLLLSILQDGGADLAAVDRSFAQMSLRGKPLLKTPHQPKGLKGSGAVSAPAQPTMDNVPNLVARRCFESLHYIVSLNEQASLFFLSEHENVALKRPTKKGKGKEKVISSKYPIVLLLDLLERPTFVQNSALMEQLMMLLSIVCRPFANLFKTAENKSDEDTKDKDKGKEKAVEGGPATATTTGLAGAAEAGEPTIADTSASTGGKTEAGVSAEPGLQPPVIPDHCLQLVVGVLTAGECSSKTFQFTLSVIQNLCILPGARDTITSELVRAACELGAGILENLEELSRTLENAISGVDVQGMTLEKFSPASSKQAKLLRILKTIDYMYSRKQTPQTPAATQLNIELAPTVDPEEADAVLPRSMRDLHSVAQNLNKDEQKVTEIYDSLKFQSLWMKVGQTLEQIHERSDMIHVATVLLPLIESLMVVCKYVGLRPSTLEMEEDDAKNTAKHDSTEDLFLQFTEKHSKILNIMVRNNPALMSGSFSLLVHNPKMLEFDNKRNYFTQQLHKRNSTRDLYGSLQMNVRREMVFMDSYSHWQSRTGDEIKHSKLNVKFHGEEGVDGGGVTREWFQVLARQMFNPDYALFKTSAADKLTYQPNRASWVNQDHLLFFKFIGRVIGKAIYDGRLLDAYFTRSFYKHILGRPVDYRDVEAVDPEYYKSLVWMLENDITDIVDETFSVETDDFGKTRIVDLKPDGRNIPVTEENKHEYVKYITEQKLTLAIKDQIHSFLLGFHEIIPAHLISIFNEQELELLISGLPDIDIDEWKNNSEYQNYTQASPQIQNFWRAVRSFDQTERAKLLQFVTGTSKVPLGGFPQLQGISGIQKFQIHKDFSSTKRLPSAHTCFNQLDLPEYETYEELRHQLLVAISECSTGFAFA